MYTFVYTKWTVNSLSICTSNRLAFEAGSIRKGSNPPARLRPKPHRPQAWRYHPPVNASSNHRPGDSPQSAQLHHGCRMPLSRRPRLIRVSNSQSQKRISPTRPLPPLPTTIVFFSVFYMSSYPLLHHKVLLSFDFSPTKPLHIFQGSHKY